MHMCRVRRVLGFNIGDLEAFDKCVLIHPDHQQPPAPGLLHTKCVVFGRQFRVSVEGPGNL